MTIWTLITILGDGSGSIQNGHPNAAVYGGTFTFVGTLLGQNVYAVCSLHRPQIDSSGALWIQGDPSVVAPGYIPSANPVPTCNALEPCCDHIVDPIIFTPTPPVSLPFNGVDCAGAPLPTTANSSVFITGTQAPIPVCITGATTDTRIDFEIGCSSIDGRTILLIVESTGGIITSGLFETDGVTPVVDGSTLVDCSVDYEDVEQCKTDGTNFYKVVTYFNVQNTADNFTIWLDSNNIIIPPVIGAVNCQDTGVATSQIVCDLCTDLAVVQTTTVLGGIGFTTVQLDLLTSSTQHTCDPFLDWYLQNPYFQTNVARATQFQTLDFTGKSADTYFIDVFVHTEHNATLHTTIEIVFDGTIITGINHLARGHNYQVPYSQPIALFNSNGDILEYINADGTTYTIQGIITTTCPGDYQDGDYEWSPGNVQQEELYSTKICGCDDINGDQSVIVNYWTVVWVDTLGNITNTAIFNEDFTAPYVPINPIDCDLIGLPSNWTQNRVVINGPGVWSPTSTTTSYTIRVRLVGPTPPTFTDSLGVTTDLELTEVITYSESNNIIDTSPIVTSTAGSVIVITYVDLV